jgi:hypothetical protein
MIQADEAMLPIFLHRFCVAHLGEKREYEFKNNGAGITGPKRK